MTSTHAVTPIRYPISTRTLTPPPGHHPPAATTLATWTPTPPPGPPRPWHPGPSPHRPPHRWTLTPRRTRPAGQIPA
ncbi:MAG: hypothetical protein KA204_08685, partial [Chromatiaceae bacterium]|nr:hypothetical protein [Chromatiaceae bacterium]